MMEVIENNLCRCGYIDTVLTLPQLGPISFHELCLTCFLVIPFVATVMLLLCILILLHTSTIIL